MERKTEIIAYVMTRKEFKKYLKYIVNKESWSDEKKKLKLTELCDKYEEMNRFAREIRRSQYELIHFVEGPPN